MTFYLERRFSLGKLRKVIRLCRLEPFSRGSSFLLLASSSLEMQRLLEVCRLKLTQQAFRALLVMRLPSSFSMAKMRFSRASLQLGTQVRELEPS